MIRPSRNDFLRLAKKGTVVAVLKQFRADRLTPIDAYYALQATYLLESASAGAFGRWSFIGLDVVAKLVIRGKQVDVQDEDGHRVFESEDPVHSISQLMRSRPWAGEGDLSPFPGGAVGFLSYDVAQHWEKLPPSPASDSASPDAIFVITRYNLVFDNLTHNLMLICHVKIGDDAESDYVKAIKDIERIESLLVHADAERNAWTPANIISKMSQAMDKAHFEAAVNKIKGLIVEGEAIQVVLSQQFKADFSGSAFDIYRSLRSINPSPYMFYLDFGDCTLLGASPEVMVKTEGSRALLRPIAGTRKRGRTDDEDKALAAELLADEKERAEHLMLIDLARNDLGRVAKPGTVQVDRMMEIELFSHVMHIVSEVSCQLKSDVDVFDLLRAVFPAGTVSGAPKIRAMEIISEMEKERRGPYAGLVGYFSYTGSFDSCITIRSAFIRDGVVTIQAGAGIVYDSVPEKEYEETLNKARALFEALSAAQGGLHGFNNR